MRKLLRNDTALRVISVFISILLWMYVVGVNNPTVSVVLKGIPVQIVNNEQFDSLGLKVISVGHKTVDLTVEGRHSDVAKVSSNDIAVTLDVSKVTKPGKYNLNIQLKSDSTGVRFANNTASSTTVFADYVVSVNKDISVKTSGEPKEGFFVDQLTAKDSQVLVRGPKSIVDTIDGAIAYIDIEGADGDFSKSCALSVVDGNEKKADLTYVTTNITETMVDVSFTHTKTVVVNALFEDKTVLDNYDVKVEPATVDISGSAAIVKSITQVTTSIVSADDIANVHELSEITLNVGLNLPEGVSVTDNKVAGYKLILTAKQR